jgi:hypothetical protein
LAVAEVPALTRAEVEQLRAAAELAEFQVEAGLFLLPETFEGLEHHLLEQDAATARARYEAAAAQFPDRTPFAGRA